MKQKRILFVPLHSPSLLEMLPLAEKLAEDGQYEPVFFIFRDISSTHLDGLKDRAIRVIGPKAHGLKHSLVQDKVDSLNEGRNDEKASRYRLWKQKLFASTFFSFFWHLIKYGLQRVKAKKIIENEQVSLLVLVGDRHVGWETSLIKAANDSNISSLIVPFALSDPLGAAKYRLASIQSNLYFIKSWLDRLISRLFPNWTYHIQDRSLFFVPVANALAAQFWGIMPKTPWALGGGAATCMAVESPHLKEMFVEQDISKDKLIVTGKPSADQIYGLMQNTDVDKMYQEWGVTRTQKVLLCSVPQLAEHGLLPWEEHWREIDFLLATLTAHPDAVVVLSLHPKSDPDAYKNLASKYGAIIAEQRIYSLLPGCDIFVATYSSTVVQAIGVGKPTIVVDFYDLNYTLYDDVPGVVVVNQRKKFGVILNRLVADREYYERLSKAQKENSSEWALLDGQCTRRVVDLIYRLAKN